ncbi:unnamed protein product [Ectocarpus sp. 6 AP-2014]
MMTSTSTSSSPSDKLDRYARATGGPWSLEPAAALERLVPELGNDKYKGQLGRVGVFGGSEDYTGAPFFASMSALRMGADLAYVFTAKEAAPALKAYSPELMVTPVYSADMLTGGSTTGARGDDKGDSDSDSCSAAIARPIADSVSSRLPKLHSLLLGPGMGRHPTVIAAAAGIVASARGRGLPLVLDADAIAMVVDDPGTIRGCPLAVLTPNANEFRLLCERMERDGGGEGGERTRHGEASQSPSGVGEARGGAGGDVATAAVTAAAAAARTTTVRPPAPPVPAADVALKVERLARYLGGVTVVLKGKVDVISDGARTVTCAVPGGLKRCGGIGDVLSGVTATALAWVNVQDFEGEEAKELRLWAAWWSCAMARRASRRAYETKGRATSATDVFENVGIVFAEVSPPPEVEDPYND